jgi:hypothetical protein
MTGAGAVMRCVILGGLCGVNRTAERSQTARGRRVPREGEMHYFQLVSRAHRCRVLERRRDEKMLSVFR